METQTIDENNQMVQNAINDLIAYHGVDGNIIADDETQYVQDEQQLQQFEETQVYQQEEATQVYQPEESTQEYQQEESTQVYQQEESTQEYHEQMEGQEYIEQVAVEGQQYIEQIGVEGQEYQEQETQLVYQGETQEYQAVVDGQEYEGQETQVYEGQEYQEYQNDQEAETQVYHAGEGDQQHEMETQVLDESTIHEFIQFHGVDGQVVDGIHLEGQETEAVDQNNIEMITDGNDQTGDHFAEEVTESNDPQENVSFPEAEGDGSSGTAESSSFLSIREAVFNPNTGTLEPISTNPQTPVSSTITNSRGAGGRGVKRPSVNRGQKRGRVQNQQVKFMVPGEAGQQIVLDARTLQGLLQGGGNTITLSGASGKQSILVSQSSPHKRIAPATTRSPAKILPAPVPVGDQLQSSNVSTPKPRYMLKQGNVLTPISAALGQSLGSPTRLIQLQGSGGSNQVQFVRLMSNKQIPTNKLPIPPTRPKPVAPRPPSGGQTIFSLPSGEGSLQGSGMGNFVVLPSNYVIKSEPNTPVPIRPAESIWSDSKPTFNGLLDSNASLFSGLGPNLSGQPSGSFESFRSLLEPNGMRPRKPCNCTKSQCLKLYCDCFANGEFCHLCNCNNCYNNLNHEEDRQKAIKLVLERNPGAFRPKIGKSSQTGEAHERRHNKGCNCRRSGCLKNYCECYEAKIFCSGICKCSGCKNCIENIPSGLPNDVGVEQHFAGAGTSHRQTLKDLAEAAEVRVQQQNQVRNKMKAQMQDVSPQNNLGNMVPPVLFRYPHGSISFEVVTSVVELLLAKAEIGEKRKLTDGELEKTVLEEFGECLSSIMELGTTVGQDD